MYQILEIITPIILILFLGVFLRKTQIVSHEAIAGFKSLVVNIMLPALLFMTFATGEYKLSDLIIPCITFAVCGIMLTVGFLMSKVLKMENKVSAFFASGFEVGMLGYALFALLYGGNSIASLALVDLGHVPFVFTIYFALLNRLKGNKLSLKDTVIGLFKSPVLVSVLLGMVIGFSGLGKLINNSNMGSILIAILKNVSAPLGTIILIVIGYGIDFANINLGYTIKSLFLRLVASIIGFGVYFGALKLLNINNDMLYKAVLFIFILPPPFVLPIFCEDKDSEAMSSAISASTLLGILLFIVLVVLK